MKGEVTPKRFKLGGNLTVQFKDGSAWIRQEQRYGEIEITVRVLSELCFLFDKHGMLNPLTTKTKE